LRSTQPKGEAYPLALQRRPWTAKARACGGSPLRGFRGTTIGNLLERPIQHPEGLGHDEDLQGLVRRAGNGDTAAFRELYETHYQRVYTYAYFRLGHREQARDTAQEVFLGVWRRLPTFQYRHSGAFLAWLFRIARNVVAENLRHSSRRPVAPVDDLPDQPVEFEGAVVSRRLVVDMLTRLSHFQREVLVLRFLAGMSLAEVARVVGKSEGAVEQLQLRGLERLRREIAEE
jgi:RNA polymerase sigma-70 factor (ECF subfamily)